MKYLFSKTHTWRNNKADHGNSLILIRVRGLIDIVVHPPPGDC